ncbi:MAG: hypothetical protein PQJ46_09410 [Spirochaetales bacterium]|nr:hypothetical protein [Spirochaetales bacterium]
MSIRSQAAADVQANLNTDFDDVILTPPESEPVTVQGFVKRVDYYISSEGVKMDEPATKVTVSLLDLDTEPTEDWQVSASDVLGNEISGYVMSPEFDRTIGVVSFIVEVSE